MQYIKRILKKIVIGFAFMLLTLFFHDGQAFAEIYSSISGHVTAEDTGKGVEGIIVRATKKNIDFGYQDFSTVTDKSGMYVIKSLQSGTYQLEFYQKKSLYINPERPQLEVILPKGKNLVNVNFTLPTGASVSGAVYEADGTTPVKDISIGFEIIDPNPAWGNTMGVVGTNEKGEFHFTGLPATNTLEITANIKGHAYIHKTFKVAKKQVIDNVIFIIKKDDITGAHGIVKTLFDNRPIEDAVVYFGNLSGGAGGYDVTDSLGRFSIIGLEPGNYEITVYGGGGESPAKKNIVIESGKSIEVNFEIAQKVPVSQNILGKILGYILSVFVSDAEAADLVPVCGLLRAPKNGPYQCDKVIDDLKEACKKAKKTADSSTCFADEKSREKVKNEINNKRNIITCAPKDCGYCGKPSGSKIIMCPEAFENKKECGCLEAVLFHEITHLTQYVIQEEPAYRCEKACFSCGVLPKEYKNVCGHCSL